MSRLLKIAIEGPRLLKIAIEGPRLLKIAIEGPELSNAWGVIMSSCQQWPVENFKCFGK